jgi:hypothetical protein
MAPAKTKTAKPKKADEVETPDVELHDEVYFRHAAGPKCGRVLARGKHGATIEADGEHHKVKWEHFLGHKVRVRPDVKVIDQGVDGMLVEDARGRRRYVHDPVGDDPPAMAKSLMPMVLFFGDSEELIKAANGNGPIKGRPGLTLQDKTDKNGRASKHWIRTAKDAPKGRPTARGGDAEPPAAGAEKPGFAPGDQVTFQIGSLNGAGKVVGEPGKDGAHVKDASGHMHTVAWADMKAAADDKGDGAASAESLFPPEEVAKLPARTKQPYKTWDELTKHGEEGLTEFKSALDGVAKKLGLRTDKAKPDEMDESDISSKDGFVFVAPLKGEARAKEKVEGEYGGDWSQVRDVIRATITVSSMAEIRSTMAAVAAAGLLLAQKPKDKFTNPTPEGYRDLNTIVKLPNGMVAELQYHLKPITAAKATAHKDYEVSRSLSAKYGEDAPSEAWSDEDHAEFHQALKRQKDTYSAAWKKASN